MVDSVATGGGRPAGVWQNAYILLTIVALLWAGNAIVGRAARDLVPPFTLALVRWGGALILLLPFAWRRLIEDAATLRRCWWQTLLLGLLGVGAFNAFLYSGLRYTTATNALLMQAAIPPLILLLSWGMFRERSNWRQGAAAGLCLIGVIIIVVRGDPAVLYGLHIGIGDWLILIAALAWGLYTVLLRWRPLVHPSSFLAATFAVGVVAMAPLAALEIESDMRVVWNALSLGAFVYVATLPSLVAYLLFNRGVALIGAGRAGQFINLMPLFGAGLAILLLDEPLAAYHLVGMALILAGILVFARVSGVGVGMKAT
jgi:drug/metabolite transporter (DMT)-like permease